MDHEFFQQQKTVSIPLASAILRPSPVHETST
jgi:hypothetical protein